MADGKFLTIEYETPEQAAAMAARINANRVGGSVRAYSKDRTLEVVPYSAALADVFTFFFQIGEKVAALFKKTKDSADSGKTTASA